MFDTHVGRLGDHAVGVKAAGGDDANLRIHPHENLNGRRTVHNGHHPIGDHGGSEEVATWPDNQTPGPSCERTG